MQLVIVYDCQITVTKEFVGNVFHYKWTDSNSVAGSHPAVAKPTLLIKQADIEGTSVWSVDATPVDVTDIHLENVVALDA